MINTRELLLMLSILGCSCGIKDFVAKPMLDDLLDHFNIGSVSFFGAGKSIHKMSKHIWKTGRTSIGPHNTFGSRQKNTKTANVLLNHPYSTTLIHPITSDNVNEAVWIIEETPASMSALYSEMEQLPLNLKTQVFTFGANLTSHSSIEHYFKEVYKPYTEHAIIVNMIGNWTPEKGLSVTAESIWTRRMDLQGAVFRVAILTEFMEDPEGTDAIVLSRNNHVDLWNQLSLLLNFTTEYVLTEDGGWGAVSSDGTINGMIGKLSRNEADAAIHGIGIYAIRSQFAQPLLPVATFEAGLMYKKSSNDKSLRWSTFFAPLHPFTWIVGLAVILVLSVITSLTLQMDFDRNNLMFPCNGLPSLLMAIYAPFMQGHPNEPESISGRIVFLALYLICWMLWASHSSMLTAYLSVKLEKPPFTSLETLLYNSEYRVLFKDGDGEIDIFKNGNAIEKEIFEKKSLHLPASKEEYVDALMNTPNVVAFKGASSLRRYVKNSCSYAFIPGFQRPDILGIYLQKNSPYTDVFNQQILKMIQTGYVDSLLRKYNKRYKVTGVKCKDISEGEDDKSFGIFEVFSLFALLSIGMGSSMFLLGFEFVICHSVKSMKIKGH